MNSIHVPASWASSAEHILRSRPSRMMVLGGLAVITRIDPRRRRLVLKTPVEAARIQVLQLGDMHVTPGGREI